MSELISVMHLFVDTVPSITRFSWLESSYSGGPPCLHLWPAGSVWFPWSHTQGACKHPVHPLWCFLFWVKHPQRSQPFPSCGAHSSLTIGLIKCGLSHEVRSCPALSGNAASGSLVTLFSRRSRPVRPPPIASPLAVFLFACLENGEIMGV